MTLDLSQRSVTAFLATTDSAKAEAFYVGQLGLRKIEDTPFALVLAAEGIEIRVSKVERFDPLPFTVLDWQVADIDTASKALIKLGIEPLRFDGTDQSETGIWTTPDGSSRIFWFHDPDRNVLSVSQRS
ncbi:MAG: VOC family protein [Pseudomonadota bacterium]